MGIQKYIRLNGTVDNIIYYTWKDIACMRQKPARVRQSPEALANAAVFGDAARSSAIVRGLLQPILPVTGRRPLMYRMNAAFRNWYNRAGAETIGQQDMLPAFQGLSLNEAAVMPALLARECRVEAQGSEAMTLMLPATEIPRQLAAPTGTATVQLHIMALALPVDAPETAHAAGLQHSFVYEAGTLPEQQFVLSLSRAARQLTLVALAAKFFKTGSNEPIAAIRHQPACIIAAMFN